MIIVCRKCHYEISEEEISEYFWGVMLKFAASSIELANNIFSNGVFSFFRAKIDEEANIKHTNKLLGRANQYEIRSPECFKYNGLIKVTNKSEKSKEDEKVK